MRVKCILEQTSRNVFKYSFCIIKFVLRSNIGCVCVCLHFHPFLPRDDGCDNKQRGRVTIISPYHWSLPLKFLLAFQTGMFPSASKWLMFQKYSERIVPLCFPSYSENLWLYVLEKLGMNNKE